MATSILMTFQNHTKMKFIRSSVLVFFIIMLSRCNKPQERRACYETKTIDSANFTIYGAGLEPKERLVVKVNDEMLFDMTASSFKGSFWKYYKYPKEIKTIIVLDFLSGILKSEHKFKDTLMNVKLKSVTLSRPYPKHMPKTIHEPRQFVSIDTGERVVKFIDEMAENKGTYTY